MTEYSMTAPRSARQPAILAAALEYAKHGLRPVPLAARAKEPIIKGWPDRVSTDPTVIAEQFVDAGNVGIAAGNGIAILDFDPRNGGDKSYAAIQEKIGAWPTTWECSTGGDGAHLYLRVDLAPGTKLRSHLPDYPGVDVQWHSGRQCVAPPSVHPSGRPYVWVSGGPGSGIEIGPASSALMNLLVEPARPTRLPRTPAPRADGGMRPYQRRVLENGMERIATAPEGSRNHVFNAAVHACATYAIARTEIESDYKAAALAAGLDQHEVDATFESAWAAGVAAPKEIPEGRPRPPRRGAAAAVAAGGLPDDAEIAMADALLEQHGADWRFVSERGGWLEWDGHRFAFDRRRRMFSLCREVVREVAIQSERPASIAKAARVAAVEKLSSCDPRVALTMDDLDRDEWLLNTPGGAVDLVSGETGPNERADLCSKSTIAAPAPEDAPLWLRFLDRITDGDREMQAYLQRAAGYWLTGSVREHVIFFLFGHGANGKSVFMNAIQYALGDYATTASMGVFIDTKSPAHTAEVAALAGARLAVASETEAGRPWAEAKLKALSGGDPITAHFMCQNWFVFAPTFKIVIVGNHKPSLRNVQEAERRRIHLVHFSTTIPAEERDHSLPDKLRAEAGGILRWAIKGCLEWQRRGLDPPERVRQSTAAYFNSEDTFGQWLLDNFELRPNDPDAWELSGEVRKRWTDYCAAHGEEPGSAKDLARKLEARGLGVGAKRMHHRVVIGLRLLSRGDA